AHRAGLVHRDFKADNVIVGEDGRARVLDFGLARAGSGEPSTDPGASARLLLSNVTAAGESIGTPAYKAPRQPPGGTVGPAADQFAFALTAFETLYGVPPFGGSSREERLAEIVAGRLAETRAGAVPRRVREALARALRADPHERYPSMDALLV